jgi:hypothetical protein
MLLARARPRSARRSRRALRVLAAVAVAAGVLVAAAAAVLAQQRTPTVTITASETSLNVGVTGQLAAGPTRFEVVKTGGDELEVSIGALRPGVTREQLTAALRGRNPEAALELVYLDGGATVSRGERRRAVTFNLRPNAAYVVINSAGDRPSDWEIAEFTVGGQSNGATVPRADASVRMVDLRFRGATTLPFRGVVRFANAGWAPHFAVTGPLRPGASTRAVGRALRRNDERRLGRLVDFDSAVVPQATITRGAVDYNEVRFPRRGRYVMVCFFENHNAQGMYRFVRVR